MVPRAPSRPLLIFLVFSAALLARLATVAATPATNRSVDLSISMDAADLLRHGVNPYDLEEAPETRRALRLDSVAFNGFTAQDQATWDRYASSQLPLNLLFYRGIALVSFTPPFFRLVFVVLDSVLAAVVALCVIRLWPDSGKPSRLLAATLLGAFSPVLLKWGAALPVDKGTQILLMLAGLYWARAPGAFRSQYLSAFLLGCAVAFKLLGAFLLPLGLKWAIYNRDHGARAKRPILAARYTAVASLGALVWFLPFVPQVFTRMLTRLVGSAQGMPPLHASPFRLVYSVLPAHWEYLRLGLLVASAVMVVWGVLRRVLSAEVGTAVALVAFVVFALPGGSMDRMNMALLPATILIGTQDARWGLRLTWIHAAFGSIALLHLGLVHVGWDPLTTGPPWNDPEASDALAVAAFVLAFFAAVGATMSTQGRPAPADLALPRGGGA